MIADCPKRRRQPVSCYSIVLSNLSGTGERLVLGGAEYTGVELFAADDWFTYDAGAQDLRLFAGVKRRCGAAFKR